jgi:hypothetical protein
MIDRLLVRLSSARLDRELAAGSAPESSRLLTMRADLLVSPPFRIELADNWDHLLDVAAGRVTMSPQRRAMLRRERITDAEPQIRELSALLRGLQPVPARGVVSARALLTDGTGPVYSPVSTTVLSDAIANVIAELDPASRP